MSSPEAFAKPNNDFSRPYGLIVHNSNQDRLIPRIKGLSTLLKYFPEVKTKTKTNDSIEFKDVNSSSKAFPYIKRACDLNLFDCRAERFYPNEMLSQYDFLTWFFKLKYSDNPTYLKKQYPKLMDEHLRVWLEARRLNLLTDKQITYKVFQDFLYRDTMIEANFGQSYREGLMVDFKSITPKNYHNLKEIRFIKNNLQEVINNFNKKKLTSKEKQYIARLKMNLNAFKKVETSLKIHPYILDIKKDLDPAVSRTIREYGLQEVLQSYTYDYSHNAAYRQHNLTTGVKKVHGKVYKPGEVLNYWQILLPHLWEFKNGWVIASGESQWKFGGGICGSSSMVFNPSWRAGLEILERRSHSQYFTDLYPMEDIGLDATVYRPAPNLKIRNNTDSAIVFNVIDDKENKKITIEIIGNKQYKNIRIEGPIQVSRNHVKWIRHLEDFDGKITSEVLESRYGVIY